MNQARQGALFGIGAYVCWGVFPLYVVLLKQAGAFELLAHRIVWSLLFVAVLLCLRPRSGRWRSLRGRVRYLVAAAVLIGANWAVFIWLALTNNVVEASLGYFINPIFTVFLGVLVLGEKLTRPQWVAVGVSAIAVAVLTVDYGRPPWGALTVALAFGLYGLCKKKAKVGALEGLAVETAILAPLAMGYLGWLELTGSGLFGHGGWVNTLLLAGTGIVTATPLLMFSSAATRVPLTMLGLLQYIAPTMQFLIGVLLLSEPMPLSRLIGFVLVWIALAIFTWDSIGRARRLRKSTLVNDLQ